MAWRDGQDGDVIGSGILAMLLLATGTASVDRDSSPPPGADRAGTVDYAQLVLRERVIVRVRTPRRAVPPPRVKWRERKAPRCMATDAIAGAAVTENDSVDFVLKGGKRLRARLESDCPALDYDGGFYLAPTADRKVCADRDSIHARSGGECEITRFRTLVPDSK